MHVPYEALPAVLDLWECIDLSGYLICIDNMAPSMRLPVYYAHSDWPLSLHQYQVNLQLAALLVTIINAYWIWFVVNT